MVFFPTNPKKRIMIILVTLHLKMVAEAVVVLVALEVLVVQIFLIYLRTFLETLVEVDEVQEEVQTIEVQI